jgi:hypothetical protein
MCSIDQNFVLKEVIEKVADMKVFLPERPLRSTGIGRKLDLESYTIYGNSGFKNTLEYTKNSYFPFTQVGSVHCKFMNTDSKNRVSILIFSSGKLKISGGLSKVKSDHENYIEEMVQELVSFFTGRLTYLLVGPEYNICMLNAQFRIDMTPQLFRKFLYKLQKSDLFFNIKEPTLSGRGRISSAKVYPFDGRRSHFAIDPKGSVQMFAFKSFDEIELAVERFLAV